MPVPAVATFVRIYFICLIGFHASEAILCSTIMTSTDASVYTQESRSAAGNYEDRTYGGAIYQPGKGEESKSLEANDFQDRMFLPLDFNPAAQYVKHKMAKYQSLDELKGATLRVIIPAIEPPYVNYANFSDEAVTDHGYGPGVVMELLKDIANQLDLKYEIIPLYQDKTRAAWSTAFRYLQRNEADVVGGAAIMTYDRSLVADLTYPFESLHTGVLAAANFRQKSNAMLIVTDPFHWQVWMMVAICIIVSSVILFIFSKTLRRVYDEQRFTPLESLWVFFSIIVQQGIPEQPKSWTIRVLISLWWLAAITLSATFTGSLVALFAVTRQEFPFNSFEQLVKLVKQGKYSILMDQDSTSRTEMIASSQLPIFKELWHEIEINHRIRYVQGAINAANFVAVNPNFAFLGPRTVFEVYQKMDCRLFLLQETILPSHVSIALRKDSPYSTFFSNRIQELVERGFTNKWIRDYINQVTLMKDNICNATHSKSSAYLDLNRTQGAFWVLSGGLVCSVFVFVFEIIFHYVKKNAGSPNGRIAQLNRRFCSLFRRNC